MATPTRLAPHRNRWIRILGVAFVMYVLSYIDRTNIAMAIPALRSELGLGASAIGFATGMFFWGYIVLQIPAGRLAAVWKAKWVILGLLLFWSLVSFSTAFVRTENELIANRFVLGLFEGGVLTCTIVLIRKWFTRAERARANTVFLVSIPIASVIANPISGIVLAHFGWQMMFIVEALPGLVWAAVWIWAIAEQPSEAAWLDPQEKARLVAALEAEAAESAPVEGHWIRTLWHPVVLLLALYNFAALMAEWGVTFWLPTVLKETGLSIVAVGFLSAIPSAVGAVVMILVAISSDRLQERKWHMIGATALSGVFLLLAQLAGQGNTLGIVIFLTLAVASFLGRFGPFWSLPTEMLPPAVAGVGIGLVNGAGNLGGTVGPYFFGWVREWSGSFTVALTAGGISLILGSLLVIPIRQPRKG
ncbi:Sugar phosphate permease [Enhydrobacter aerosaccus]|uniref:Sugar phosphate permease n=1 Tax=Enhydrobacter aerosaccus TaxID=225324 RepID=A0A1T4TEJ9_9HYPH|nr:MFS transporter [Enhydrobacter aerosaccus]SKA38877.1 Sugar phosphate permease [Enhydrobacter aerosaccus]